MFAEVTTNRKIIGLFIFFSIFVLSIFMPFITNADAAFDGTLVIEQNRSGDNANKTLKELIDAALATYNTAEGANYNYSNVKNLTVTGIITANNASSDMGFVRSNLTGLTNLDLGGTKLSGAAIQMNFQTVTGLETAVLPKAGVDQPDYTPYTPGNGTFYGLANLKSADISGASGISSTMFLNCSSLTDIILSNTSFTIGSDAFANCSALKSIDFSNVTSIGTSAFSGCTSFTSVTLDNVTSIGNNAFNNCTALTNVTLPSKSYTLSYGAFRGCSSLTSIDISNATSIG